MKKLAIFFVFILVSASTVFAETVALSTYYPAPFGAYDRLRLVPRLNPPQCTAALEGLLYYDDNLNVLKICRDPAVGFELIAGVWSQTDIDAGNALVYLTDTTRSINVGIGTTTPQEDLHIAGDGELLIQSADVGITMMATAADDFKLAVGATNTLDIQADSGGGFANVMRIGSNGNVAIGDVIPADNFLVDGGGSSVTQRINIDNGGSGSAWLRLTGTNFQGGFLRYDSSANELSIGVHNNNDSNPGGDNATITINRGTGDVLVGSGAIPGSPEQLNVNGKIRIRDDGTNWGNLMVNHSGGNYYAVYAP